MSLHRRRELVTVEVFRKGRIKPAIILQHTIAVKLGQKKEYFQEFSLVGDESHPDFIFAVSSYKLRHFY